MNAKIQKILKIYIFIGNCKNLQCINIPNSVYIVQCTMFDSQKCVLSCATIAQEQFRQ